MSVMHKGRPWVEALAVAGGLLAAACKGEIADQDAGPPSSAGTASTDNGSPVRSAASSTTASSHALGSGTSARSSSAGTQSAQSGSTTGTSTTATRAVTDAGLGSCMACPSATADTIYLGSASAGICPAGFTYNGATQDWYGYNDGTSDAGNFLHSQQPGGCDVVTNCASHASGSGFTGYGAGAGITLNANAIFDASAYTGIDVWMRGFTKGTRGPGFQALDNAVHVKFVTGTTADAAVDPRLGDDFGAYCPVGGANSDNCYTPCRIPFASLVRDGLESLDSGAPDPATDTFDPRDLVKIQFEMSAYSNPDGTDPVPVSFDVWIDGIEWYR
jgi:hypothetical protein